MEHNRTLQREVQQLRWDKGELRRKWAAHKKVCPCFGSGPDLDSYESPMAIKTEPISDEEDENSTDMKKLVDSDGQENEMELSFASMASVLCSSPIAGFPKNFPAIANISEISEESLSASLCSEMIPCSPSSLDVMDSSFLHDINSITKSQKNKLETSQGNERGPAVSSHNQIFIQTTQACTSTTAHASVLNSTSASNSIISATTTTVNNNNIATTTTSNDIRYNLSAPSTWQQSALSPSQQQQKFPSFSPQSSCMFEGTIPQPQGYYSCQNQPQQIQLPQHTHHHLQHQGFPPHHSSSLGQGCHPSQYSENHSDNSVFHLSAALSMASPNSNTAACASPSRQRCAATIGPQTPKSAQYPDLCRLLQPHPSPAQVVPSISTCPGDSMQGSTPNSTFHGVASTTGPAPGAIAHPPNFLCNRPRSVLASGGSTPDAVRGAMRDGDRGRCSSESSDGSGPKVPSSAGEAYFPRRSTETPDIENDDVFSGAATIHNTSAAANYSFDSNNNSALVSDNNVYSTNTTHSSRRASSNDVMLFSQDGDAETSSVLEGVRHLIDCSGYSNSATSCSNSNTPNSISSNSSMRSEVDDLLFEIPSDALLFFAANGEVDVPQAVFPDSL